MIYQESIKVLTLNAGTSIWTSLFRESTRTKIGPMSSTDNISFMSTLRYKNSAKMFDEPQPSLTAPWLILEEPFWNMTLSETKAVRSLTLRDLEI